MKQVIVVVGPTGVGKTKMGVALAQLYNGEVISGDSMQIYRMMDIGTAKATTAEMAGVPHHLLDVRMPDEGYSVSDFQTAVRACIDDIIARGKVPIIVGGTGLYIKAVLYDYTFEESDVDHEAFTQKYASYTNEDLHAHLASFDVVTAQALHPNNRRRVMRAIEIYETTGRKKSEIEESQSHTMIYDAKLIGLTLPREQLYERIDERVLAMMADGLKAEVTALYEAGYDRSLQAMKAIGYKEWFPYFDGLCSEDDVIAAIQKNSRNYAKRQYTWFNHQMPVAWYDVDLKHFETTIAHVKEDVDRWIAP